VRCNTQQAREDAPEELGLGGMIRIRISLGLGLRLRENEIRLRDEVDMVRVRVRIRIRVRDELGLGLPCQEINTKGIFQVLSRTVGIWF
jgi:hypothetical protein